jgi:AAA domain
MRDGAPGGDPFAKYDWNPPNDQPGTLAIWIDEDPWVETELPPRPWVAPGYALRGAVTIIAGPPSALKSSLMLAWGCAVALGQRHVARTRTRRSTRRTADCW